MTTDRNPPPDESSLHAYVDGRLPTHERDALQSRIAADPEAARTVKAWMEQRDLLRALHRDVLQEPPPAALLEAARQVGRQGHQVKRWQRWGGMAASVLVAFAVGWLAHGQWEGVAGSGVARSRHLNDFGRQAVAAYVVYSPEVRHPVEVPAAQQEH